MLVFGVHWYDKGRMPYGWGQARWCQETCCVRGIDFLQLVQPQLVLGDQLSVYTGHGSFVFLGWANLTLLIMDWWTWHWWLLCSFFLIPINAHILKSSQSCAMNSLPTPKFPLQKLEGRWRTTGSPVDHPCTPEELALVEWMCIWWGWLPSWCDIQRTLCVPLDISGSQINGLCTHLPHRGITWCAVVEFA